MGRFCFGAVPFVHDLKIELYGTAPIHWKDIPGELPPLLAFSHPLTSLTVTGNNPMIHVIFAPTWPFTSYALLLELARTPLHATVPKLIQERLAKYTNRNTLCTVCRCPHSGLTRTTSRSLLLERKECSPHLGTYLNDVNGRICT